MSRGAAGSAFGEVLVDWVGDAAGDAAVRSTVLTAGVESWLSFSLPLPFIEPSLITTTIIGDVAATEIAVEDGGTPDVVAVGGTADEVGTCVGAVSAGEAGGTVDAVGTAVEALVGAGVVVTGTAVAVRAGVLVVVFVFVGRGVAVAAGIGVHVARFLVAVGCG